MLSCRSVPTWYSRVSSMLMLNTLPAAKGRRNMKAKLEPLSRSFCGEPGSAFKALSLFWTKLNGKEEENTTYFTSSVLQFMFIIHTMSSLVMAYLLQFGEGQWIAVLCSELHESHVGWMSKLRDNTEAGKQPGTREIIQCWWSDVKTLKSITVSSFQLPEHRLYVDNRLGVGHVVLLGTHCALFIHNDQIIGVDDTTLQQAVQTETHMSITPVDTNIPGTHCSSS